MYMHMYKCIYRYIYIIYLYDLHDDIIYGNMTYHNNNDDDIIYGNMTYHNNNDDDDNEDNIIKKGNSYGL